MKLKSRRVSTALAVAVLTVGGVALATAPAQAVACAPDVGASFATDRAWISDTANTCGTIGVRHLYQPSGVVYQFWTSWYSGTGNYYITPTMRELVSAGYTY